MIPSHWCDAGRAVRPVKYAGGLFAAIIYVITFDI